MRGTRGVKFTLILWIFLCIFLANPASAQPSPPPPPSPPSVNAPIVVTNPRPLAPGQTPSIWKRVAGEHVVVYSDGPEGQAQQIAFQLERLHALLARLYPVAANRGEPARLKVVLFDNVSQIRALGLDNPATDDKTYIQPFANERYYDPREDGSVLAIARTDQIVRLDTPKARARDCEDIMASTGNDCAGITPPYHPPVFRPWEAILYGAYAQHVVLNHAPALYPRWYFDGIAMFFSTVKFTRNGQIRYGSPPEEYRQVFRSYGLLDTTAVLSGRYLLQPTPRMDWTPYHAWLLTHFFIFSHLKSDEAAQFRRYMDAIAKGQSTAVASRVFGGMKRLSYRLLAYSERPIEFTTSPEMGMPALLPVEPLSQSAAQAMLANLAPHA